MARLLTLGEAVFQKIVDNGVPFIKDFVNAKTATFEEEWLDFKTTLHGKTGETISDRELSVIWAKALSGFANSGGGTLVWGIISKKARNDDRDIAREIRRVKGPDVLESKLRELATSITEPPVNGVQYWHGYDPEHPTEGFVACYIPPSTIRPHRSRTKGDKDFYFRSGTSFHPVPLSLLRMLFFPEYNTSLEIHVNCISEQGADISIKNNGHAPAERLTIIASSDNMGCVNWSIASNDWSNLTICVPDRPIGLACTWDSVLYPGTIVGGIRALFKREVMKRYDIRDIILSIDVYSKNSVPGHVNISISKNNLDDKVHQVYPLSDE